MIDSAIVWKGNSMGDVYGYVAFNGNQHSYADAMDTFNQILGKEYITNRIPLDAGDCLECVEIEDSPLDAIHASLLEEIGEGYNYYDMVIYGHRKILYRKYTGRA